MKYPVADFVFQNLPFVADPGTERNRRTAWSQAAVMAYGF